MQEISPQESSKLTGFVINVGGLLKELVRPSITVYSFFNLTQMTWFAIQNPTAFKEDLSAFLAYSALTTGLVGWWFYDRNRTNSNGNTTTNGK